MGRSCCGKSGGNNNNNNDNNGDTFPIPGAMVLLPELVSLFSVSLSSLVPSIVTTTDTADNNTRRQRFINYITPQYSEYPHIIPIDNGYLVLLDSMQGELNENTSDYLAQGKLGQSQLSVLETRLTDLQPERKAGKKVIVSLHHSPFKSIGEVPNGSIELIEKDDTGGLSDHEDFLSKIANKVDCLLFGHTSPSGHDQRPYASADERGLFTDAEIHYGIPLINCENLEHMNSSYSITVLDLGSYKRVVFQTDPSIPPEVSWGNPPA